MHRPVTAHRATGNAAAVTVGNGPVVGVDLGHQFAGNVGLVVADGGRTEVVAGFKLVVAVGEDQDHLLDMA